jgi:hypothetical protein
MFTECSLNVQEVEVEAPKITGWGPKAISARFKQAFLGVDGKLY